MKNANSIKQALLGATLVAAILLIASSVYSQERIDAKDLAEKRNDAKLDDSEKEKDAKFLVNAAEIDLKQIQLGQLAQESGQSNHIKELGKMMEEAHTKSLNELTALAKSKNIEIPTTATEDAQEAYKDLNEEPAEDFDKAYSDEMVRVHDDAISTFKNASEDSNDTEIKNWATNSLPGLHKHLDQSMESQKRFDTMYLKHLED